ncbi:GNAT family N-acetyltransferase [Mucilaginibacter sp.]|uniref:GNAT family N-acetyltransferase n=1 Tax=Mucilaginibacter sp. TaxID=1882438 RepID=UPI000CBEB971|nr:GNAT family protein [Mucilaginibacter sp.]PLW91463.1 MAG: N-acetyltransferase [Mucilaginibacter sp.]HEK20571.1 N-acetyltransferase [Bacteroidota bacterium]
MELSGEGFKLRPWKLNDAESLQKHANNFNVSTNLLNRFPYPYLLDDARYFIEYIAAPQPNINFAIEVNGFAVGGIALQMRDDVYSKSPLIGYWLSQDYWGRGIAPKAIKLVTGHAFENLEAICVMAFVFGKNTRSMKALEKAGYTKRGILTASVIKNGEVMDEHIYAINRS